VTDMLRGSGRRYLCCPLWSERRREGRVGPVMESAVIRFRRSSGRRITGTQ
jgi:hypothetical protein